MAKEKNSTEKDSAKNAAEQKTEETKSYNKGDVAVLADSEINLTKPLNDYAPPQLRAYAANCHHVGNLPCVAIITDPRYTPRVNVIHKYQEVANPNIARLVTYGVAKMPGEQPDSYALIYEANLGKRLYAHDDNLALGWKAERVLEKIAIPIIMALRDLQYRDLVHGNIRATNLYDGGKGNFDSIVLGDCLALPASMAQSVVYEPVERAMAEPIGRGEGTIEDDLYALGILLAMHLRSYDPLRGKSNNEIISAKVMHGSFSAMIGNNDRFSGGVLELLRGLLMDDQKQRWTLDEVMSWVDGRRLTPKQALKRKKASRALMLDGISYYYASTLAHNMVNKPQEAVSHIESNELSHWVERSLIDEEAHQRLQTAIEAAAEGGLGAGYWDRLLPRVSIAIDPDAPIRYKGMSFHPKALGNAMAESFIQKKGLANFIDLFNNGILYYWVTVSANLNKDISAFLHMIDKCRSFLKQRGIHYGIERCLYTCNPVVHCLSPLVENYFVRTPEEYLMALEEIAKKYKDNDYPGRIIDKHAACFLIARDNRMIEPYTYDLGSEENFRHILGTLQVLATIQRISNTDRTPHLSQWISSLLGPVIDRFHSKSTRIALKKQIDAKKSSGDLSDILNIVESPEKIREDQHSFRTALKDYFLLETEVHKLNVQLKNPKFNAERSGREWAATIAGIVSALLILGFIMVHFGSETPL